MTIQLFDGLISDRNGHKLDRQLSSRAMGVNFHWKNVASDSSRRIMRLSLF